MQAVVAILTNEAVLPIIMTVATALWSAFKSSEYMERKRTQRTEKIIRALEVGVHSAYQAVVKAEKERNAKLSEQVRASAHTHAVAVASHVAGEQVEDVLTDTEIDAAINRIVNESKSRATVLAPRAGRRGNKPR